MRTTQRLPKFLRFRSGTRSSLPPVTRHSSRRSLFPGRRNRTKYSYDYQGRRYQKIVNGVTNTFQYDGWNLTREISSAGATNSYVWGMDLSGSLQGAGGIGGLLCVIRNGTPYYPYADGNGNITDYVDTNGVVVAHREYDAYGNTLVATGAMVNEFHFWFSSKYLDSETGLYYYGHRFYHSGIGRWMSRDPIGTKGGINIYVLVGNKPIHLVDPFGLIEIPGLTIFSCAIEAWGNNFWNLLGGFASFVNNLNACAAITQNCDKQAKPKDNIPAMTQHQFGDTKLIESFFTCLVKAAMNNPPLAALIPDPKTVANLNVKGVLGYACKSSSQINWWFMAELDIPLATGGTQQYMQIIETGSCLTTPPPGAAGWAKGSTAPCFCCKQ